MQAETKKIIARSIAMYLVKAFGEEVENLTVWETVSDEVPGLDQELQDEISNLVFAYLKVAHTEVYFDDWRVNDDGTVKEREEYEKSLAVAAYKE